MKKLFDDTYTSKDIDMINEVILFGGIIACVMALIGSSMGIYLA